MPDTPVAPALGSADGKIVTFYSYKGGTGRTMALANVAWILAANGRRVLAADWDLESPGLHRFFHPFLDENTVRDAAGIINLIRAYEWAAAKTGEEDRLVNLIPDQAKVQRYAMSLSWDQFPPGGRLDFLSPGQQNMDYAAALGALDWDNFHDVLNGGEFLDALRADMKRYYDYVLIDSRTGLSDVADICTVHLPDILVDCFTLSTQGIEGAAHVARVIEERYADRGIRILPVPMRVDQAEKEKVEIGHAVAVRLFAGLPAGMSEAERRAYWAAITVPYRAFYAYEETLAVFGDAPSSPEPLLSSFERIAAQITDGAVRTLPPMDEQLRNRTKLKFARRAPLGSNEIVLEFAPEDQVWGDWIADVLRTAGVVVREQRFNEIVRPDPEMNGPGRTLTVVSAAYLARQNSRTTPDLAIYVATAQPPSEFSSEVSASVAGVPEKEAVERLCRLVGIGSIPTLREDHLRHRYPGIEPKINTAPVPNIRFTGRENDLRELREQLAESGSTGHPVNIQGLGGVGKTQIAIEYVHRFKTDYDLIWWLDCGQPQFIDASLADLGARMQDVLGIAVAGTANVAEVTRQVLELLAHGNVVSRWLLVFDNAEYIDAVKQFLPAGGGDVVITSRHRDWAEHARPRQVDVFSRKESIAHLRKRIPTIDVADADQVAELLGDLPLAVATAGAWLAETGIAVSSYKSELERRAPRALALSHPADYRSSVPETWGLSLNLLRERSPAAARLFELCSVMAPNIALDLLYSPAMASILEPFEPALVEPMVMGSIIREIDRLALIKLDHSAGQIQVHRLVQTVVRDRMSAAELAAAQREVHEVLAAARPSRGIDNPETWPRFRLLWPHLGFSGAMTSDAEVVRQLFIDRVRYLWLRSDFERGREVAVEVESAWEKMLDTASEPGIARSIRRQLLLLRFDLANILRDLARFAEAKALDEIVLHEQRDLLGPNHPHTLMTAGGLAADLRALGSYRDALEMDKTTYPAWTELYGEGHERALRAANNLAVSYRLTGDVTTALRLDEQALQLSRTTMGPLQPHTLRSATNVVRDLVEAGRYAEAAIQIEVVRQACVEGLGSDSREALNAELLFGIALRSAGRPEQAESHFLVALEGLTARFGGTSTEALAARLSHAVNLLATEHASDAEPEIHAVRTVYEERLGPTHPHSLVCLIDLACALRTGEPHAIAMQTVRSAITGLEDRLGHDHPYTLAATAVLGVLLADAGDLDGAEEAESHAVEHLVRTLGPLHPDALRTQANLLLTQLERGVDDAEAERDKIIERLATVLGADHPHMAILRAKRRLLHFLDPQPF